MKFLGKLRHLAGLFVASAAVMAAPAVYAAYPDKPITIIVPFSPGGATDMLARTIGQKLTASWGQPVVVDNRPGAGGNIGAAAGARAAPDGYTLTLTAAGIMAVNPHIYPKLTYDSIKDFAPVTQLVNAPLLLVVHPSVPANNFKEYLQLLKSQPGKITVGNGGTGTAQHLGAEFFDMSANVTSVHVPYKGSAPATTDLIGGQVQALFDNMVTLIPHIKAGKLKPLAVTSTSRVAILPDVPTVAESGLPGFETGTWYGIAAPAGTPKDVIHKLQAEIARILAMPDVHEKLKQQGLIPVGSTPEQFGKFIESERVKSGKIVKAANIKLD
ncbi:MAG: Bug family tripartite tricarboxylate transporter substrate binding protein [Luteimonas sp.]